MSSVHPTLIFLYINESITWHLCVYVRSSRIHAKTWYPTLTICSQAFSVTSGTKVYGNVFVGWDASNENVQIKTGSKTPSHFVHCSDNYCSNPEVPVPGLAWQFIPCNSPSVEFHGEGWQDCDEYPRCHKQSFEKDALCILHFEGSKVVFVLLLSPSCQIN